MFLNRGPVLFLNTDNFSLKIKTGPKPNNPDRDSEDLLQYNSDFFITPSLSAGTSMKH
jgi:hypothetical protein